MASGHKVPGAGSTLDASHGLASPGFDFVDLPEGGGLCDGYGDDSGDSGGYGDADPGYGHPCTVYGWYLLAVQEESVASSVISALPRALANNWVRQDGGQLVILGTTTDLPTGFYQVAAQVPGTDRMLDCYSGIQGQGRNASPGESLRTLSFVWPQMNAIGECTVRIDLPSGERVEIGDLVEVVPFATRSLTAAMKSWYPSNRMVAGMRATGG